MELNRKKQVEQESLRRASLENRAQNQTSLENAIKIVIANGSLFRFDCLSIACANKSCNRLWEEIKKDNAIPPNSTAIEVKYVKTNIFYGEVPPHWGPILGYDITKEFFISQDFLANVFYTVNDLQARSRPTKKERTRALAERPK